MAGFEFCRLVANLIALTCHIGNSGVAFDLAIYAYRMLTGMSTLQLLTIMVHMLTPRLCKTARTLLDIQQRELAEKARVNLRTLMDFERGVRDTHPRTVGAI